MLDFIKKLLMIKNEDDNTFIGLSSFKYSKTPIIPKKTQPKKTEVKISDLMRKNSY